MATGKAKMLKGRNSKPAKTDVDKWLTRIDRAKKVKDEWKKLFRIPLAYDYLEGRQMPPGVDVNEWITINMYYSILRATLPTLYRIDPYFYVRVKRSYKPDPMLIALYEQNAETRQAMLNYLKGEINLKPKVRMSILDCFFQFGVAKTIYQADMVENPDKDKQMMNGEEYIYDDEGVPVMEPESLPANEAYVVTRIHPHDFLVDEDAGPLEEDITWCAQRIVRHIDDVKEDKRYRKEARDSVQPTELTDQTDKERQQRKKGGAVYADSSKDEPELVVTWEIYNLKDKTWLTVAEGCKEFLMSPEDLPKGIEKHPFTFLKLFARDDSWYPIPPATQWIDAQREYCDSRSKILIHRKRFNRKYEAYMAGLVDDNEIAKLEIGDDGTIIRKNIANAVITPIQDAPLDQNNFQELLLIRKDFEDLAIGPNQRGSAQGVDSATEAGIIEKRMAIQEGDDVAQVVDFVTRIAEKLDQLIQTHITEDQAVKVTGPDGATTWQLVRAASYGDTDAEYSYSVNTASMTPQLPEIERAQWLSFLTALSNAPQLALSKRLLHETARMFHIEDETMIEEIQGVVRQMMSGQLPMPGTQGSAPGSPALPQSSMGMAQGINNIRGGA